ncbi:hypothetical protein EVAR_20490_1 [Eumeta japonica]|uniref:Uncharacterized protein n=1 Tax=Eumeta variegata TaxID=151549 RepID=A0A4C1Y7D8_EUMVA|nr:hypothetical protein EVAR_20490_1 [Eumeta japonica]
MIPLPILIPIPLSMPTCLTLYSDHDPAFDSHPNPAVDANVSHSLFQSRSRFRFSSQSCCRCQRVSLFIPFAIPLPILIPILLLMPTCLTLFSDRDLAFDSHPNPAVDANVSHSIFHSRSDSRL